MIKLDLKGKISKLSVILLFVAAAFTLGSAFAPVWRIDLTAPQYPEGMVLYIGGMAGLDGGDGGNDLYKINELNHYVGMAQMHPGDFWEFSVLPYLLIAFAILFGVAAVMKSKKLSLAGLIAFGIFGILGFIDFYHWTYVYGHNLSPSTSITGPTSTVTTSRPTLPSRCQVWPISRLSSARNSCSISMPSRSPTSVVTCSLCRD